MGRSYIIIIQYGDDPNKAAIRSYIKEYPGWARITDSSWAIVSDNERAKDIRNDLIELVGEEGRVFVVRSGTEAAWKNPRARNEWFKKNL